MNRREFLKKSLEGIVIASIPFISCSKNPVESESPYIFIDKTLVADSFGNSDGTASKTEVDNINNYFISNIEAWGLGGFHWYYWNKNEIPLSVVRNTLKAPLYGPFKNEDELRKNYEGMAIKTPYVGIYVFTQDGIPEQYRLKCLYYAPGPNVSEGVWIGKRIIK